MILSFINIHKVPREMLKTSGFALGFQHHPWDLANVNEWKIMFDPYNQIEQARLRLSGTTTTLQVPKELNGNIWCSLVKGYRAFM